jgi:hypothetical protein
MSTATPLLSVYSGRDLVGFVLARGARGFEAFDAAEKSLGMFASRDAAINKCVKQTESKQT